MKRMLISLLCLVLFALPMASLAETMYVTSNSGSGVHLRSGPSTDAEVLTTVPYGAAVDVTMMRPGASWAGVDYKGHSGYMMERYLTGAKPDPKPTAKPKPKPDDGGSLSANLRQMYAGFEAAKFDAKVVPSTPSTYVNLRWAPSMAAPVRSQYWSGSGLTVLSQNKAWSEVHDPKTDTYGYVMSNFLIPLHGSVGGS